MTVRIALSMVLFLVFQFAAFAQIRQVEAVQEESSVTYKLVHPLHEIEATSKDVRYSLEADCPARQLKHVSATVDVTTFDSGNSNRDSHAMEVIDAITFPEATFTSTSITQVGDSVFVVGKLTFHGVTKDVAVAGGLKWSENKLVVRGSFGISLAGFEIERPSLLLIPVEDALTFSIVGVFEWK